MSRPECADDARRALAEWAANNGRRDEVVRAALVAGVPKSDVHELTGIARTTIDRIIAQPVMKIAAANP